MDSTEALKILQHGDLVRVRTSNGGRAFGMFAGTDTRYPWDAEVGMALPVRFVRIVNRTGVVEIDVNRISKVEIVLTEAERAAVAS